MKSGCATQPASTDRGAVLVQTALVLLALFAFAAFAVDYGVLWASRRQAQNAADAAALAGAISFAFDSTDTSSSGEAYQSAQRMLLLHRVWAENPVYTLNLGTTSPPCPPGESGPCIRVDVYRDQAHSNPLPTFFGRLVNVNSQGVRASAIAVAAIANATDCLGPFSIADRFIDTNGDGLYNTGDVYTAPAGNSSGTGYSLSDSIGLDMLVKAAQNTEDLGPGWFRLLDISGGGGGGTSELNEVIRSCTADIKGIGDSLTDSTESGNSAGIKHGIEDLISTDPGATWDPVTKTITNSCVTTPADCYRYLPDGTRIVDNSLAYSPRILAISIFDPALYWTTGEIRIVNLLGFFIWKLEGPGDKEIHGILVTRPGVVDNTKGGVPGSASFLKTIRLIR